MSQQLENLKELLNHPNWQEYLDILEHEYLVPCMQELMLLEPTKAENFAKFIQLKARIDTIRDITYLLELQIADAEDKKQVADSYTQRFMRVLKSFWRKDA